MKKRVSQSCHRRSAVSLGKLNRRRVTRNTLSQTNQAHRAPIARHAKIGPTQQNKRRSALLRSVFTLASAGHVLTPKGMKTNRFSGLPTSVSQLAARRGAIRRNLMEVRKNWAAISAALELAYGDVRAHYWAPHNRHIISRMLSLVKHASHVGVQRAVKEWSAMFRRKAIMMTGGCKNRGKTREANFLASTLSRAVIVTAPSKEKVNEEVQACVERITTRTPLPNDVVMKKLDCYIDRLMRNAKDRVGMLSLPLPQAKSCYERSASKGGAALEAYHRYGKVAVVTSRRLEMLARHEYAMAQLLQNNGLAWSEEHEYANFRARDLSPELQDAYYEYFDTEDDSVLEHIPMPGDTVSTEECFKNALKDLRRRNICRPCPIVQPDGKIRVATLHTSAIVWAARALTSLFMPYIKDLSVSRAMLRNADVKLATNKSGTSLYSADLSKSTDPISVEMAQHVLLRMAHHIPNLPEWVEPAIQHVIGEQDLEHNGQTLQTTCGALMGLGPGWTVLTVLNSFAADMAGCAKESFNVCGDDLIGLWTDKQIRRYADNLEILGLKANKSKSFIDENTGVFCERLVIRTGPHQAKAQGCLRIGEAVGSRACAGGKGRVVVDHLSKVRGHRVLMRHARRTARSLAVGTEGGAFTDGGAGGSSSSLDAASVVAYAKFGSTRLFTSEFDKRTSEIRQSLYEMSTDPEGLSIETALTIGRSEIERITRAHRLRQGSKPTYALRKTVVADVQRRRRVAKTLIRDHRGPIRALEWLREDTSSACFVNLTAKMVKRCSFYLRLGNYRRALKTLKQGSQRKVSAASVEELLQRVLPEYQSRVNLSLEPVPLRERDSSPSVDVTIA